MRINVLNHVTRDVLLEIAGCDRTRIHGAVVDSFGIRQHKDHLLRAFRERTLDYLRSMDLLRPLLGTDAVAVESVDDRVSLFLVRGVPGWEIDDYVTIDTVALEIAFERGAVYLDFLDGDGF